MGSFRKNGLVRLGSWFLARWSRVRWLVLMGHGSLAAPAPSSLWIAVCTHVLVLNARKRLNVEVNLHTILQIPSVTLLETKSILHVFSDTALRIVGVQNHSQLLLFCL